MLKTILIAAVAVCGSSAALANHAYTFADTDNDPYCDGITLTQSGTVATGTHTGHGCTNDAEGNYAGGLKANVPGTGQSWVIVTTDPAVSDYVLYYVIDENALTWTLYDMSTTEGFTFTQINGGNLLLGPPRDYGPAGVGGKPSTEKQD